MGLVKLTPRQREILNLICRGKDSVKEVAFHLNISPSTVRGHLNVMLREFRVESQLAMVVETAKRPDVLLTGFCDLKQHPEGCNCPAIWCTSLRLGALAGLPPPVHGHGDLLKAA